MFRVPEIGEDLPEKNPLLQQNGLPEFNNLTIENCMAAIGKQTLEFEVGVRNIEDQILQNPVKDIFKDVLDPLENLGASLDTTWGLSKTLYLGNSTLMPTKSYLSIHDRARRARATKFNSSQIYGAIKDSLKESNKNEEQTRVLKKFELEGKLNGLDIDVANKAKLEECLNKLAVEKDRFKTKTELSTKLFRHQIKDINIVRDFPVHLLKSMAIDPKNYLDAPWIASLQPHVYLPFMEHCPDRELRWNVWQAMVNRGSTYGNKEYVTSTHLEEIRYLRREQANLLGYKTFADMSMETKMAGSVQNVKNLLLTLLQRAMPAQERELINLHKFATDSGFKGERIELWDVPYWRRKQQVSLFDYKEEVMQEYFPLPKVLEGLFNLCEQLFKVTIKQRYEVSTWDKDVKFYDVFEPHSSAPVAGFYLDPYTRTDEKSRILQNSGSMIGIQNRSLIADVKPLAALIFNFQPPLNNKPSLLTFKDVSLLFHKFGYALQHLLTRTSYSEVSGLSNIEWDVVEVCGYVLSQWLYNKDVIHSISSHCDSEEKLPADMLNMLVNIRKHTAGLDLCRELYLSALDLELHSTKDFWLDIVRKLWPRYRCFPLDKMDSHPCSFTHIFVEEWASAYYSHVWARVIAADVYSAFHEAQGDEQQIVDVGKRFRDTFLALGGSCNPSEVFRKFRGRDPSPKALLSSLGLKQVKSAEVK